MHLKMNSFFGIDGYFFIINNGIVVSLHKFCFNKHTAAQTIDEYDTYKLIMDGYHYEF